MLLLHMNRFFLWQLECAQQPDTQGGPLGGTTRPDCRAEAGGADAVKAAQCIGRMQAAMREQCGLGSLAARSSTSRNEKLNARASVRAALGSLSDAEHADPLCSGSGAL